MTLISIFFIAVGLALDAFAVSVACGLAVKPLRLSYAFRIAFFFGVFQAFMPVVGWAAGVSLRLIIASFDHWIAFILLFAIGCKMIYESFGNEKKNFRGNAVSLGGLLVLSLATSIDAFAVGISFAFLKEMIFLPASIIGVVTFALCLAGVWLGNRFGHIFENKFEIAGGLILIGIAIKILVSHLAG
ncbi:MAG: manganese efflux pump MntP family protein [Kiritimatiellia bacterium]|nr:manganese efflux pump MntP family protein [Kiritimatiellia bacterium]